MYRRAEIIRRLDEKGVEYSLVTTGKLPRVNGIIIHKGAESSIDWYVNIISGNDKIFDFLKRYEHVEDTIFKHRGYTLYYRTDCDVYPECLIVERDDWQIHIPISLTNCGYFCPLLYLTLENIDTRLNELIDYLETHPDLIRRLYERSMRNYIDFIKYATIYNVLHQLFDPRTNYKIICEYPNNDACIEVGPHVYTGSCGIHAAIDALSSSHPPSYFRASGNFLSNYKGYYRPPDTCDEVVKKLDEKGVKYSLDTTGDLPRINGIIIHKSTESSIYWWYVHIISGDDKIYNFLKQYEHVEDMKFKHRGYILKYCTDYRMYPEVLKVNREGRIRQIEIFVSQTNNGYLDSLLCLTPENIDAKLNELIDYLEAYPDFIDRLIIRDVYTYSDIIKHTAIYSVINKIFNPETPYTMSCMLDGNVRIVINSAPYTINEAIVKLRKLYPEHLRTNGKFTKSAK